MEILKFVLIGIAGLVALVFIIPLFTKNEIDVHREVLIHKPLSEVFEYVKLLKNQNNFSVWANKDPEMKKDFVGIDGTVGFVSKWESKIKDVGKGEQEIKKIAENQQIDYELRFIEPFAATNFACFSFEEISEKQTKVKWVFSGKMKYPMNLFLLIKDMDGMLGKDLQEGLENLKIILDK